MLIAALFPSELRDQDGQLTEDVSVHNGTYQVDRDYIYEFTSFFWSELIATNHKHRIVEANAINEEEVFILDFVPKVLVSVVVVIWWLPSNDSLL